MKIWIDADACPKVVKEIVFKASKRTQTPVCLVANSYMSIPADPLFTFIQVDQGADVADFYIANNHSQDDLVITADIPLATQVVKNGATAINPRGELYTEENVGEKLSTRDFMQGLRNTGMITGGPMPLGPKDKAKFANAFDRILTKMKK